MTAPSHLPDVDAIVVNRDGGDALFRALDSLERQRGVAVSVLVVDNASEDLERARIARDAPRARVIPFSRNLGFAAAANEGISRSRSPFVLLVNNDAELEPDYAARLAARLAFDERIAGAQGLVLSSDGARVDSAGLEWNDRGEAVPILSGADPSRAPDEPFEVAGVSATAALFRRQALEALAPLGGAFDSSFFAYYEDVDLSLRLARAGWRFVCDPGARARHEGSRTGRRTPFRRALWTARNRWRTLVRHFDRRLLVRDGARLIRADLAHARRLGWRGPALLLLTWATLPFAALKSEKGGGRMTEWPRASRPAKGAVAQAAPSSR